MLTLGTSSPRPTRESGGMIAVIAAGGLLHALVVLVIIGLILWIVWWAVTQIPMPEPIRTVVRVLFVLIMAIVLINFLMGLIGEPFIAW